MPNPITNVRSNSNSSGVAARCVSCGVAPGHLADAMHLDLACGRVRLNLTHDLQSLPSRQRHCPGTVHDAIRRAAVFRT